MKQQDFYNQLPLLNEKTFLQPKKQTKIIQKIFNLETLVNFIRYAAVDYNFRLGRRVTTRVGRLGGSWGGKKREFGPGHWRWSKKSSGQAHLAGGWSLGHLGF